MLSRIAYTRFSAAKCAQNFNSTPHFTNQAAVIANQSNNKSDGLVLSEANFTESSPRFAALLAWVASHVGADFNIHKASEDASFRRYFRVSVSAGASAGAKTWVVMDAPPEREKCALFVRIADMFAQAGLHAPRIAAQDLELGFLLLEDLGRSTYLQGLAAIFNPDPELENTAQNKLAHSLFVDAIDALVQWQLCSKPDVLPPYDEAVLRREIQLFPDWYVVKHRNIVLSHAHQKIMSDAFNTIVHRSLNQALVFVHRDFMPRNLMICSAAAPFNNPGILDFQDALYGPISYDIAALFKDAFISWKEEQILDWTIRYWEKARKAKLPVPADFSEFYADCEWMALQRHLKILGLFARINYRDGKPNYLADTPRFIAYVRHTCDRYRALGPLLTVIDHIESTAAADVGYTF